MPNRKARSGKMNLFEIPEDPFKAEVRELYRLAWRGEVDLSQT